MADWNEERADAIAIIGASGRFPKAKSLDEFWAALRLGQNCTDTVSFAALKASGVPDSDLDAGEYITATGRLDDVMLFDASLFGLSTRDAELMDPQQRKFLECSYEALESAGYAADSSAHRIGVYAAATHSSYLPSRIQGAGTARVMESLQMAIGNDRDYFATRVSHLLNLTGPSFTLQTACSSSLTAVHVACQSLLSGECDMALAGGVSITLPQTDGYRCPEGFALSRNGVCRPFDAAADGPINGNGAGVILLKPLGAALRDNDVIRAVIRGTAANNDGSGKVGYTAPSLGGEAAVVAEALSVSGVPSEKIGFVSAHGTATAIGDPIEIEALVQAFDTTQKGFCSLGAVKANIGHLDSAAGIAGLIEAMLALEHKELPPIANFCTPNPQLRLEETPFVIRTEAAPWNASQRFAMANAFGLGGTNVSVVLEEAPERQKSANGKENGAFILPLSARTPETLRILAAKWRSYLETCGDLANACWTAACRRRPYKFRTVIKGGNRAELVCALDKKLAEGTLGASDAMPQGMGSTIARQTGRDLLPLLCEQFDAVRETATHCATRQSLPLDQALLQPEFCEQALEEVYRTLGIGVPQKQHDEADTPGLLDRFLDGLAQIYCSGVDIQWGALLTGKTALIPTIPFNVVEYCHPLAQRRERLPVDPVASAQAAAARLAMTAEHILAPDRVPDLEARLEDLSSAAVVRTFAALGFKDGLTDEEALETMGIPPQFTQLAERLLEALCEKGLLNRVGNRYRDLAAISDERFRELKERVKSVWEVWGALETMTLSTVEHLPDLLRGQLDLLETLMPNGDLSGARRVYSELPNSIYFNSLIREHVRAWLDATSSGEAVRIFEIGGGTAATTERIVPLLPPDRASYMFSDVSPVFLRQAQARFCGYEFFRTGLFNMEEPPEKQGFEVGIYDIVIAANVLHAATDLSAAVRHAVSLLRPGGLILLYEITRPNFLGEITTGLLLPNITDTDVRGIQPMASNELWKSILAAQGFERIQVFPENGKTAAALPDKVISAVMKRRTNEDKSAIPDNCAYHTVWETRKIQQHSAPVGKILLVAADGDALLLEKAARLKGLTLHRITADVTEAGLQALTEGESLCTVVDARALGETESSPDCTEQNRLCGDTSTLLHTFASASIPDTEWRWASLTYGAARNILHPHQATLWGMNRVVEMGHPELHLKAYDFSDKTLSTAETFFDLLLSGSAEEMNAISGNEWQVPRLKRCAIAELPLLNKAPDKEGWQLIVGGLGGLGLALASDIAARGFGRIALVGRHAPDSGQQAAVLDIQKRGARVAVLQADVTDYKALEAVVAELETSAPIRSIYHCAVVKRVKNADSLDRWEIFRQILAPKVQGAWNLHRLSESHGLNLDRMVFFSSSVSVMPTYNLPHYVAANTYLDSLAMWRRGQGLPALSVSWGAWKDIGTVADPVHAEHLRNGGVHTFSPDEGLALLNDILQKDVPHLAVMRVEWPRVLRQYGHCAPAYFEQVAENPDAAKDAGRPLPAGSPALEQPCRSDILQSLRDAYGESERLALLENWLKNQFAETLKTSPDAIERSDSLFELGVDSLMFIEMSGKMEKSLGIKISPSSLLRDFCIDKMAQKLLPQLALVNEAKSDLASLYVPEPEKCHEPFRLTDVQRAYWVGRRQEMALGNNACQGYIEFDCDNLDVARLEKIWLQLIERHDTLRTVIDEDGMQRVLETTPPFSIPMHDLTGKSETEQQEALQSIRERLSRKVHDPALWPLFDIEISLLSGNVRRLHILIDNLVMDGLSVSILLAEWASLYHDPNHALPPVPMSFRDYVSAMERYRKTDAYHEADAYWEKETKGLPPAPALPLVKDPATIAKPHFVRYEYWMAPALWGALKNAAGRHGVTPSSVLLAAYAEVLGLWSRSPQFTVNAPVFTRLPVHPDINSMVGEFTSSVLLRCDTSAVRPFLDKARAAQQRIMDGLRHCQVSGVEVMRRKIRDGAGAEASRMPVVFTSTFGLAQKADERFAVSIQGFSSLGREVFNVGQTPQVWLDNHVHDRKGTLGIYWDTVEELFPAGMIGEMFSAYCRLIERLAEDEAPWTDVAPAAPREKTDATRHDANPAPQLLHAGFLRNAVAYPDRIAVIDGERKLSYGELYQKAASLAERLAKALPCNSDETPLVAVALPKGWRQAVAVLGVLFAGAAYVPIEPGWPPLRRSAVLDEAMPLALVALENEKSDEWNGLPVLSIGEEARIAPVENFLKTDPQNLAYVIFTSGSTGTPKGVMMNHAGAMATIEEINLRFGVTETDRVLALSSLSFDLSVYDFFGLWAAGGAAVIPDENEIQYPEAWRRHMDGGGVTIWNSVPMFWQMLLESGEAPMQAPHLALLSGDRIPSALPSKSAELFARTRMVSLGGATEAGIWSICHEIMPDDPQPGWQSIPYGRALKGQSFHVLHGDFRPCPFGVPGELYIGGAALALGYLRNPQKTAEHFVVNPFTGERLYRTGDLGVRHACGEIEFLGRIDSQVKIGGYRIELGDVEAAFAAMPELAVSAVVLTKHGQLAAFAVPKDWTRRPDSADVRMFVKERLPQYMVPPIIKIVEQMPLSANGKLDRKKLAENHVPDAHTMREGIGGEYAPAEMMLCTVWREILDEHVSPADNVFALGADSLAAVRAQALLKRRHNVTLSLQTVFDHPVVREMAAALDSHNRTGMETLRQSDSPDVLFCLGDAFADGGCFHALARYWPLGSIRTLSVLPQPGDNTEAILERICNGITSARPQGVLRLAGFSAGGLLAWLAAKKLQERGRIVDRLILIDSAPLPSGIHADQSALLAITESTVGQASPELLGNLGDLCALLEDVEFPKQDMPCAFIQSLELSKDDKILDFWRSRTGRLCAIPSSGTHAECMKRGNVLQWLGNLIAWYESGEETCRAS